MDKCHQCGLCPVGDVLESTLEKLWDARITNRSHKAYREARRAAFGQSVARLQQASTAAVSTLLKIMVDPAAPAASRVRAADCVLDRAIKGIEVEDIEVRLLELERTAENKASRA